MATRTLTVKLVGDTSKLDRAFGNVSTKLGGLSRGVGKLAVGLGGVFAAGVAGSVPFINAASDLNEELSKSEAVFGGAAAGVQAFADGADKAAGLSKAAALQFGNSFGQLGKAAGLGGDDLGAFSTDLLQLAADLASFNNISVEEAAAKLQSGLAGETEPLKQLGVFFNAAAVEAKALELGLVGANGEISDQNKILARNALIFEQTTDAQGDFARTSGGLANKQRILSARFKNLQAQLGQKLLPVALKFGDAMLVLADKVGPVLLPVFDKLGSVFGGLFDAFKGGGIGGGVSAIGDSIGRLMTYVGDAVDRFAPIVWDKYKQLLAAIWGPGGIVARALPVVAGKLSEWAAAFVDWVGDVVPPLMEKLNDLLRRLTDWIKADGLNGILDKLIEWGDAFIRWVAPMIPPLLKELAKLAAAIGVWIITDALPKLASWLLRLGKSGFEWLWRGFKDIWSNDVVPWLKDLPNMAWDALRALPTRMLSLGIEAMHALWDGFKAIWPAIANWLENAARNAFVSVIGSLKSLIPGVGSGSAADELLQRNGLGTGGSGTVLEGSSMTFEPSSGGLGLGSGNGGSFATPTFIIEPHLFIDSKEIAMAAAEGSHKLGGVTIKQRNVR